MVEFLPLHQVLVPSTIPGPTRLDMLFGLGICWLVAASILWVVVFLPLKPCRPPKQQPADTGADGHGTTGAGGPGDGLSGLLWTVPKRPPGQDLPGRVLKRG